MKNLMLSYIVRAMIAYALLCAIGYVVTYAQPPAWLNNQKKEAQQPQQGAALAPPATKIKTVTKRDTITITDTVVKIDTLFLEPKNPKYKYKLQICNLDYNRVISFKINLASFDFHKDILDNLNNEEKTKNCYFSSSLSDTVYRYSYGIENTRTNGYIYDNYGNKLEQTERILVGVTLNVRNEKVTFDYLENKKLALQGSFYENQVNFYADYTYFERRCNFWVFCNYVDKKQYMFLNLTREEM